MGYSKHKNTAAMMAMMLGFSANIHNNLGFPSLSGNPSWCKDCYGKPEGNEDKRWKAIHKKHNLTL